MSSAYNSIKEAIVDTTSHPPFAIQANYKGGGARSFWPHVIGTSSNPTTGNPEEIVLCYQYGGNTQGPIALPHPNRENFRCFKVASLTNVAKIPFNETWTPFKLKPKHVKRQNCVDTPDVYR